MRLWKTLKFFYFSFLEVIRTFGNMQPVAGFVQKMLRVKDEELSLQERRDNSYHRRRRYSEDYDSEADLYQQYKAAGLKNNMVAFVTILVHINLFIVDALNQQLKPLIRNCMLSHLFAILPPRHGIVMKMMSRLSVLSCVKKLWRWSTWRDEKRSLTRK